MRRSAFLASAAAVAVVSPAFPVRADATPLRLAYIPTENNAQAFYAQELGLFAKAGLDVQMQPINFSAAIASGVLSGAIDIGNSSSLTLTVAHNKGLPLVFVAPANAFLLHKGNAESGIVVAAASPIRVAKDLNGKTFGCSGLGSFGEYIPRAWVDANGGDSSTMKFIEAPNAALGAAVSSGRADAAFISPPAFQKSIAEENCRMLAIASDAVAKEFMASGWFTTTAWAKANAPTVAAFASAIHDATLWARANPERTVDILVKYLKLDPAVVRSSTRATFLDGLTPAMLQPPIDVVARYAKFPPFPAEELVYVPPR